MPFPSSPSRRLLEADGSVSGQVLSGEYGHVLGDREKAVGTFREFIFFHEAGGPFSGVSRSHKTLSFFFFCFFLGGVGGGGESLLQRPILRTPAVCLPLFTRRPSTRSSPSSTGVRRTARPPAPSENTMHRNFVVREPRLVWVQCDMCRRSTWESISKRRCLHLKH